MAMKDASFEAYRALHTAGLVNDNLLPVRQEADDFAAEFQIADDTPSLIQASQTLNPWISVAEHQQQNPFVYHRTLLQLSKNSKESLRMILLTPIEMPKMPSITLYWNETERWSVHSSELSDTAVSDNEIALMRAITHKLLSSAFRGRMSNGIDDYVWLLLPSDASGSIWSYTKLQEWSASTDGAQLASELIQQGACNVSKWGVVSIEGEYRRFLPQALILDSPEHSIKATRVPKRRDFLHVVPESQHRNDAYSKVIEFPVPGCLVNNLPAHYSTFARLMPSILYKFETYMVAETLRTTLLAPLAFAQCHLPLILRTLTASSTGEEEDYQRYVYSVPSMQTFACP